MNNHGSLEGGTFPVKCSAKVCTDNQTRRCLGMSREADQRKARAGLFPGVLDQLKVLLIGIAALFVEIARRRNTVSRRRENGRKRNMCVNPSELLF